MSGARALVVIPCLDEEHMLPGLLAQLLEDGGWQRIVVADGGSRDRSRAIVEEIAARYPEVVLLDNPARLQSAGINRVVETLSGDCDWLIRVDAHCCYPRGYVRGLLVAAAEYDCQSVVVPMLTKGQTPFQRAVAAAQNSVLGTGGSPHRHVTTGRYVEHGHHAAMRLDLYRRVGGYDEGFSHNEDAELDQRLIAAGAHIWLEPALAIVYHPRRDIAALFRQYRGYGRGRARTAMRHRNRMALRQMLPLAIAPLIVLALVGILIAFVSQWYLLLTLPAVGWLLICLAMGTVLALKARSVTVLASGVAAATMHAGWSLGNWEARLSRDTPGPAPAPMPAGHRNDGNTIDRPIAMGLETGQEIIQ